MTQIQKNKAFLYHNVSGYIMTIKVEEPSTKKKLYYEKCNIYDKKKIKQILDVLKEKFGMDVDLSSKDNFWPIQF